jgi:hypothetical protein
MFHFITLITFGEQHKSCIFSLHNFVWSWAQAFSSQNLQIQQNSKKIICLISGFCCAVYEICALLGCYAVCSGNSLVTFQDNIPVPSSGINKSKNKALFLDLFTFEDGTDRLTWTVSNELAPHAVSQPRRAQVSKKLEVLWQYWIHSVCRNRQWIHSAVPTQYSSISCCVMHIQGNFRHKTKLKSVDDKLHCNLKHKWLNQKHAITHSNWIHPDTVLQFSGNYVSIQWSSIYRILKTKQNCVIKVCLLHTVM